MSTLDTISRTPHGVRGLKSPILWAVVLWWGRTPHGVRGLKFAQKQEILAGSSRTPHGVRGLKCADTADKVRRAASHPARGAWIEIFHSPVGLSVFGRRTPHGVRGLKLPQNGL